MRPATRPARKRRTGVFTAESRQRPPSRHKPTLAGVLKTIRPGRDVRLYLDDEQKLALSDRDGRIACHVLRAVARARQESVAPSLPPREFPFTEPTIQAVAARLGHTIGIKRCRAVRQRLIETGLLTEDGSYREPYRHAPGDGSYRVRLYTIGVRITGFRFAVRRQRPVGRRRSVKRSLTWRFYQHALFGTPDGRPPPGIGKRDLRRWLSADEMLVLRGASER